MTFRIYKSRSPLDRRDYKNLDLVSKKWDYDSYFFCWNHLCDNFKASVLFFSTFINTHTHNVNFTFPQHNYFHFHPTSGETAHIIAQRFFLLKIPDLVSNPDTKWQKFSISSWISRLNDKNSRSRLEPWNKNKNEKILDLVLNPDMKLENSWSCLKLRD